MAHRGLTLIELLIVAAVIALLLGLLLPAVQQTREAARRSACGAHLSQIALALQQYHEGHGSFPPGCIEPRGRRWAWSALILPHLEQPATHGQLDFTLTYRAAANLQGTGQVVPVYLCPSTARLESDRIGPRTDDRNADGRHDPGDWMAVTDYGGLFGTTLGARPWQGNGNGMLIWDQALELRHAADGASQTLLVGEDTGRGRRTDGEWSNGENIFDQSGRINELQNNELWSDHPRGVQAVAVDRSVRFLSEAIDPAVLAALLTRDGHDLAE